MAPAWVSRKTGPLWELPPVSVNSRRAQRLVSLRRAHGPFGVCPFITVAGRCSVYELAAEHTVSSFPNLQLAI